MWNQRRRVVAIGRIPDSERFRDRIGFYRTNLSRAAAHGINDGVASGGLRSIKAGTFGFTDKTHALKLLQAFVDFADHGAACHRNDDRIRRMPAQRLGHLVSDRLRAFRIVRTKVHIDEAPGIPIHDLTAQPIDRVVITFHSDEARAVDLSPSDLAGFEIVGDEND